MKKVIFIGGTARSGSTLLDLILANDTKVMSLGEIYALFRPTRKHHFEEIKKLKQDPVWSKILKDGKKLLYPNLIKYYPDIDIFVDSSKDPFWFSFHEKIKTQSYQIKHVLIYKSPEELAKSFIKRGKHFEWIKTYINYHKKYFSLINSFVSISYKELLQNDESLKKLCKWLGIEYFKGKKNYWEKEHHSFFGSNSVKSSDALDAIKQLNKYNRKVLSYEKPDESTITFVNQQLKKHKKINTVYNAIRERSVTTNQNKPLTLSLKYNRFQLSISKIKKEILNLIRYYRPKNYFKKT